MNALFHLPLRRHAGTALVLFLLAVAPVLPVPAAEPPPVPAAAPPAFSAPPLADGWTWNSLYHPVEHMLSSRAGLLRLGMIGMFLALLIIMCNKWNKW